MNSKELAQYFWDTYNNGLTDIDEFVKSVNHQTTLHDDRVIKAIYIVIDNIFMGEEFIGEEE